jgi:hypothetical protein
MKVCRLLRLGGRVEQEFAIIAKFLEPSGNLRGLIGDHWGGDSSFGANISRSQVPRFCRGYTA